MGVAKARGDSEVRSMFKNFAEGEGEYVCRSKRKVRPSDAVLLRGRRSVEELMQLGESNGDCHVIFERRSKKAATQREAGTLN